MPRVRTDIYYPQPPTVGGTSSTSASSTAAGSSKYPQQQSSIYYPQPGEPLPPQNRPSIQPQIQQDQPLIQQPPPQQQPLQAQPLAYQSEDPNVEEESDSQTEYQSQPLPSQEPQLASQQVPKPYQQQQQQPPLPSQQQAQQPSQQQPDYGADADYQSQSQGDFTPQIGQGNPFTSQQVPYATMPTSPFAAMQSNPYGVPPFGAYPNPYGYPPYFGAMVPPPPYANANYPFRPFPYAMGGMAAATLGGLYGGMRPITSPDAHRVIRPSEIKQILPSPSDTSVDRDLTKLLQRANKYGDDVGKSQWCRRKYTKYVFLCGYLMAKRGLPAFAVPDDPEDVSVKLLSFYLADPMRMGADAERMLVRALHHHHHHHRHHRRYSRHCRRRRKEKDTVVAEVIVEKDKMVLKGEGNDGDAKMRSRSVSRSRKSRSREPTMSDESDWQA